MHGGITYNNPLIIDTHRLACLAEIERLQESHTLPVWSGHIRSVYPTDHRSIRLNFGCLETIFAYDLTCGIDPRYIVDGAQKLAVLSGCSSDENPWQ